MLHNLPSNATVLVNMLDKALFLLAMQRQHGFETAGALLGTWLAFSTRTIEIRTKVGKDTLLNYAND